MVEFVEQATSWKLEEAIQLFYVGNESGAMSAASPSPVIDNAVSSAEQSFRYATFLLVLWFVSSSLFLLQFYSTSYFWFLFVLLED